MLLLTFLGVFFFKTIALCCVAVSTVNVPGSLCTANYENLFTTHLLTFFRSSTFQTENTTVTLLYTQGHWSGILGRDLVTIPVLLEQPVNVNIACIQQSQQFFINGSHWQGILGLAYPAIAKVSLYSLLLNEVL